MSEKKYENFRDLKYFRPTDTADRWGKPEAMDRDLLVRLDYLRETVGSSLFVTSGYRQGRGGSQHFSGRAVDIIAPHFKGTLLDLYNLAYQVGFIGIGIYPHWQFSGKAIGGLHVDVRPGKQAKWMGVLDDTGKQVYIGLTKENLKKYGVIEE